MWKAMDEDILAMWTCAGNYRRRDEKSTVEEKKVKTENNKKKQNQSTESTQMKNLDIRCKTSENIC